MSTQASSSSVLSSLSNNANSNNTHSNSANLNNSSHTTTAPSVIFVIVMIETKAGFANQQIQAFRELRPLVLAEKGCLQYELTQDINHPNQFVLIEKWETQVDLDAHDLTPHMIEADKQSSGFRVKPATVFKLLTV